MFGDRIVACVRLDVDTAIVAAAADLLTWRDRRNRYGCCCCSFGGAAPSDGSGAGSFSALLLLR